MADQPKNSYIRTYAKDVASLSSSDPAAAQLSAGLSATHEDEGGRSAVLARLRARSQKEPPHENVVLPSTLPTPSKTVAPSQVPYEVPREIPRPTLPASEPSTSRIVEEHIIERKVESVPPTPPPPAPAPLSNLPPPPPPVVAPAPTPVPAAPKVPEGPSPLHTYTTDFADRIDTKGASTFSVLAAQADAAPITPQVVPEKKSHRNAIVVAFGVVLLLLGGAGAYAAYRYVAQHSYVPTALLVPSLVFADDRQAVTGEGASLMQAISDSANSPLPDGQVRVLYVTETTTVNKKAVTSPLPGGRLLGALQLSAPDLLLRNIGPESTVGIVHAGPETRAFFILRVLSYERTFAGMLQWEGDMASQLRLLYPAYPAPAEPAPTTATSTAIVQGKRVVVTKVIPAESLPTIPPRFVDEVTSNHDVRAYKDGQGRTLFLYGYRDKDTLIIARDEAAFAELSTRLSATKQQ